MAASKEMWLKIPTFVFAILSLIGSIYVCSSAFMLRCLRKRTHHHHEYASKPIVITHLVFWLSLSDILINIWILVLWIPPTFFNEVQFYSSISCKVIGAFGQFFLVATSYFYFLIICITWTMMTAAYSTTTYQGRRSTFTSALNFVKKKTDQSNIPYQRLTDDFTKQQSRYFSGASNNMDEKRIVLTEKLNKIVIRGGIFAFVMSVILTAVPFIDDGYGYVQNVNDLDNDVYICWINGHFHQLSLYVPIAISMLFALILTMYSLFRLRKISKTELDTKKKSKKWKLIERLLAFAFIFVMTWIFPIVLWSWITIYPHSNPPFFLIVLTKISFGCIGLGNSFIWLRSNSFQSCCKSIKQYRDVNSDSNNVRISQRIKRLVTGAQDDEYGAIYNQYITKINEQRNGSVYKSNKTPQTYKLDRVSVHNLNRHKKSFKTPQNSMMPDEKTTMLNENSDIQMSQMGTPSSPRNTSKSIPINHRQSTILSDVFGSDDELEFSVNSSQSRFSLSDADIFE